MPPEITAFKIGDAVLYKIAEGEVRPAKIVQVFPGEPPMANLVVDLDGPNDTRYQSLNRRELDAFLKTNPAAHESKDVDVIKGHGKKMGGVNAAPTPEECHDLRMWRGSATLGDDVGQFQLV